LEEAHVVVAQPATLVSLGENANCDPATFFRTIVVIVTLGFLLAVTG
jgi:hypothetical protein